MSLFFGYFLASIPSGWRALTRITPRVFLILPLAGWVLYYIYKLAASAVIGPFVLPFRLSSSICLLANIEASKAKLWGAVGGLGILIVAALAGSMNSTKAPQSVAVSAPVATPASKAAVQNQPVVRKVTGTVTEISHPRAGLMLTVQGADGVQYMFQANEGKVNGIRPEEIRVGDELRVELNNLTQNYPPTYGDAERTTFIRHTQPTEVPVETQPATARQEPPTQVSVAESAPASKLAEAPAAPAKSADGAAPVRTASGRLILPESVMQPLLIESTQPAYPPMARQAGISGTVVLKADISATGTVENVRVLSGQPMLTSAASDAVKRWRYKPYIENGEPVPVQTQVTVPFVLGSGQR
jgi:TonB family protein